MSIGTILMILALIAAILVLDIGLRPPPLYGPPEKNDKAEGEPVCTENLIRVNGVRESAILAV
jgi:hypothetical protein